MQRKCVSFLISLLLLLSICSCGTSFDVSSHESADKSAPASAFENVGGEIIQEEARNDSDINSTSKNNSELISGRIVKQAKTFAGNAAIKSDGSLWTWGENYQGQLGNGENKDAYSLIPIKIMENVISVSGSSTGNAAITSNDELWSWGRVVGNGSADSSNVPVKIMDDVIAVSVGVNHSAAIKKDHSLWLWGGNQFGQLGNGNEEVSLIPIKVMEDVTAVSSGFDHTAAITSDGNLWLWGANYYGQLGDNTDRNSNVPVKVMSDTVAVYAGEVNTLAIKKDGSLWIWGLTKPWLYVWKNAGYEIHNSAPVKIMENVISASIDSQNIAALKDDGSLWMWGSKAECQMAMKDDSEFVTFVEEPVRVMDGIADVCLCKNHTTALKSDGSLWTWGRNYHGELGIGTDDWESLPQICIESVALIN